ncbi:unnamed protein product [Brachionus calyciflorus]|uniref:EGF-like domain-containing protein n=1 Tax=Brachionus calyciflorus TaxID=104777 RepID=A0A813Q181_9BILA|nr:unnamed protein product [Brachionus calyciflorus]
MKQVLIILALAIFFAIAVDASIFSIFKKYKNGCDPDPCKHKAKCLLDTKNNTQYTCNCTDGYHGKNCELKTGCYSNPCKKGKCMNLKSNPSDFVCTCEKGIVGKKCDTDNPCLKKNPCKNGGQCVVDDKLKAECTCPLGWTGSKTCEKRFCNITSFSSKLFAKGSAKVYIDKEIEKRMVDIEGLAKLCHVKLLVLKSFTLHPDPVKGNEFDARDKTNPGFYTGQAIQFQIYNSEDKLECNDICLAKIPIPNAGAKCFVDGLHAIKWKWSILDPTVFSTGHHVANLTAYNQIRTSHQVGCKDTKF